MMTCDLGLMQLGRCADLLAESKIREIRFVFVSKAPQIIEKPTPIPKRCTTHEPIVGRASNANVLQQHTSIPNNSIQLSSRPDARTNGVSLFCMNRQITIIVITIPKHAIANGTIANAVFHFMNLTGNLKHDSLSENGQCPGGHSRHVNSSKTYSYSSHLSHIQQQVSPCVKEKNVILILSFENILYKLYISNFLDFHVAVADRQYSHVLIQYKRDYSYNTR